MFGIACANSKWKRFINPNYTRKRTKSKSKSKKKKEKAKDKDKDTEKEKEKGKENVKRKMTNENSNNGSKTSQRSNNESNKLHLQNYQSNTATNTSIENTSGSGISATINTTKQNNDQSKDSGSILTVVTGSDKETGGKNSGFTENWFINHKNKYGKASFLIQKLWYIPFLLGCIAGTFYTIGFIEQDSLFRGIADGIDNLTALTAVIALGILYRKIPRFYDCLYIYHEFYVLTRVLGVMVLGFVITLGLWYSVPISDDRYDNLFEASYTLIAILTVPACIYCGTVRVLKQLKLLKHNTKDRNNKNKNDKKSTGVTTTNNTNNTNSGNKKNGANNARRESVLEASQRLEKLSMASLLQDASKFDVFASFLLQQFSIECLLSYVEFVQYKQHFRFVWQCYNDNNINDKGKKIKNDTKYDNKNDNDDENDDNTQIITVERSSKIKLGSLSENQPSEVTNSPLSITVSSQTGGEKESQMVTLNYEKPSSFGKEDVNSNVKNVDINVASLNQADESARLSLVQLPDNVPVSQLCDYQLNDQFSQQVESVESMFEYLFSIANKLHFKYVTSYSEFEINISSFDRSYVDKNISYLLSVNAENATNEHFIIMYQLFDKCIDEMFQSMQFCYMQFVNTEVSKMYTSFDQVTCIFNYVCCLFSNPITTGISKII